ncbi:MAG: flagellar hook-length control protein FliK [Lachnospiraceae bacterium]|nr:flagellar hook-length control protein FliK [Lachnospiraceae bacterium]
MRLSSLFVSGNESHIESSGKEMTSSALEQNLKNGMEEIASKAPGQSVTGEVVEKNGNEVLISIGKNQMIRAKLDGNMPVELGQQMTFSIKNLASTKVVLSPLFANTGNDPNISKALQMAGIPENARSAQMVQTMMREGMSIDRESLSQMMRAVNLNPDANVETVVQLSRLGIPVTENNIFQMEAYKNYQHQMTEGLLEIADALTDTLAEMTSAGDIQGGIDLYREVLLMLAEGAEMEAAEASEGQLQNSEAEMMPEAAKDAEGTADTAILQDKMKDALKEMMDQAMEMGDARSLSGRDGLTGKEVQNLAHELSNAGVPEGTVKAFVSGELPASELFRQLNEMLSDEQLPINRQEKAMHLLNNKEFNSLVKNEMIKQWTLTPEEVAKNNKVENLYERLNNQMSRLNQTLEQAAKADTPLGKAVSNLSGNIDFMNQLNQMFTYVQLPLKLQSQEANGELYVYTNKKNLAQKDGKVSALLHLDMAHLGGVDVHVSLMDSHVSTKFYLKDDSILDFISDHIDILNERLNKRGYTMDASFTKKGETESDNVMEEILKQDKNISILSDYSFDARA